MRLRGVLLGVVVVYAFGLPNAEAAEVINFGCPAYLIGGGVNLAALKSKGVTSVVMDPSAGISAAQAQAYGIVPIYYVNACCQPDKFKCSGPNLSGGGSACADYGETIPKPFSQFFYDNFDAQVRRVQQLGGTIIEIDNMDEYVRRGYANAIRFLIESAGRAGINVVMKNEANPSLVALSNVVGAIAEPGSHDKSYRAAFAKAGKQNAGILMINGQATDADTSVSNVNHTGRANEYTNFNNCVANAAGVRTPTPPSNYQISAPRPVLPDTPPQQLVNTQRPPLSLAQAPQQPPSIASQQPSPLQPGRYFTPQESLVSENPRAPNISETLLRLLQPPTFASTSYSPLVLIRDLVKVDVATGTSSGVDGAAFSDRTNRTPQRESTFTPDNPQANRADAGANPVLLLLNELKNLITNVLRFFRSGTEPISRFVSIYNEARTHFSINAG